MKGISGFALLGTAVAFSLTASAAMLIAENTANSNATHLDTSNGTTRTNNGNSSQTNYVNGVTHSDDVLVPQEDDSVDACRRALVEDHYPDLIVEEVLVARGINPADIKAINTKLDEQGRHMKLEEIGEVIENTEPVATNDPLSGAYDAEAMANLRFEVFAEVMKEYVTDAATIHDLFQKIEDLREQHITECRIQAARSK